MHCCILTNQGIQKESDKSVLISLMLSIILPHDHFNSILLTYVQSMLILLFYLHEIFIPCFSANPHIMLITHYGINNLTLYV